MTRIINEASNLSNIQNRFVSIREIRAIRGRFILFRLSPNSSTIPHLPLTILQGPSTILRCFPYPVDQRGGNPGAESIVDIDHRNARGAGIKHCQQSG